MEAASHGCFGGMIELVRDYEIAAASGHPSDDHVAGTCTEGQIVQVPDLISDKKTFYIIQNALPRRSSPSFRSPVISSSTSHKITSQIFLKLCNK